MKALKASKGLLKAVICLAVSVLLSVGVCLAWFIMNSDAGGKGMGATIDGTNIESLTVTAYTLKDKTVPEDGGAVTYTIDTAKAGDAVEMEAYGGMISTASTKALLLEINYKFKETLDKNYNIYVTCDKSPRFLENIGATANFNCHLSDAVSLFYADVDGTTVTLGAERTFFGTETDGEGETKTVKRDLVLNGAAITDTPDGNLSSTLEGKLYCIIDYSEDNITELYALALSNGGTLSSEMSFKDDLKLFMQETFTL